MVNVPTTRLEVMSAAIRRALDEIPNEEVRDQAKMTLSEYNSAWIEESAQRHHAWDRFNKITDAIAHSREPD